MGIRTSTSRRSTSTGSKGSRPARRGRAAHTRRSRRSWTRAEAAPCRRNADKTPHHCPSRLSTAGYAASAEPWTVQHFRARGTAAQRAFRVRSSSRAPALAPPSPGRGESSAAGEPSPFLSRVKAYSVRWPPALFAAVRAARVDAQLALPAAHNENGATSRRPVLAAD